MAYSPGEGLIDPFGGIRDIACLSIRTVGNPDERFREDALRMLRAVRFSAQLGFSITDATFDSIRLNSSLIRNISMERVRDELTKTLTALYPDRFRMFYEAGLLSYVMPEFEACFLITQNHPYHIYNVAEHSLKALDSIENGKELRWAALLHDIGKTVMKTTDSKGIDHFYGHPEKSVEIAKEILIRLRFDSKSKERILRLIKYHDRRIEPDKAEIRKAARIIGEDLFTDLLKLQAADKKAQNPDRLGHRLEKLDKAGALFHEIKSEGHCLSLKDLAVNGYDLIGLGIEPKMVGHILDKFLELVFEKPDMNTREMLLETVKNITSPEMVEDSSV